jgi:DNA-binding transcriptional ArsR family regulator
MGRALNLKTATRFVLITLANEAGTRSAGFVAYQEHLAADTGMSLSAFKSHLALLRKAQLVIRGDERMVQHIPKNERPCVYRLNTFIDVNLARELLESVDNSGEHSESGQPDSGDRQNLATGSAESREIMGSQILATQIAEIRGSGSQNPATNPLRGLYGGHQAHRRNPKPKNKDDGKRLCLECLQRRSIDQMIQRDDGRFICERHTAA